MSGHRLSCFRETHRDKISKWSFVSDIRNTSGFCSYFRVLG